MQRTISIQNLEHLIHGGFLKLKEDECRERPAISGTSRSSSRPTYPTPCRGPGRKHGPLARLQQQELATDRLNTLRDGYTYGRPPDTHRTTAITSPHRRCSTAHQTLDTLNSWTPNQHTSQLHCGGEGCPYRLEEDREWDTQQERYRLYLYYWVRAPRRMNMHGNLYLYRSCTLHSSNSRIVGT